MDLKNQKTQAAKILGVGRERIWVDGGRAADIKKAITKEDIRGLIGEGVIRVKQKKGVSKGRFRKRLIQKRKGRRKGAGSRRGKKGARLKSKRVWMVKVRAQRKFVSDLKERGLIDMKLARDLRRKISGNYFRAVSHIKLYLEHLGIKVGK